MAQGFSQSILSPFQLRAHVTRHRYLHDSLAEFQSLPLDQLHHIHPIDCHIFKKCARLKLEFIQHASRNNEDLPLRPSPRMIVTLESNLTRNCTSNPKNFLRAMTVKLRKVIMNTIIKKETYPC